MSSEFETGTGQSPSLQGRIAAFFGKLAARLVFRRLNDLAQLHRPDVEPQSFPGHLEK